MPTGKTNDPLSQECIAYSLSMLKQPKPNSKTKNQHNDHWIEKTKVVRRGSNYQNTKCV